MQHRAQRHAADLLVICTQTQSLLKEAFILKELQETGGVSSVFLHQGEASFIGAVELVAVSGGIWGSEKE